MSKGMLSVVVMAVTLALSAGCKGSEEAPKTDTPPPPPAALPTTGATTASTTDVATYPNQVPQGGTVTLQQSAKVYQAADPTSTLLTSLGPGTLVETKSRYGDWMLINWPSGVGKLSPGWVQAVFLAPRVVTDAGVPDSGTPVDAGKEPDKIPAPTATDAGTPPPAPTDAGVRVRPIIKLPKK